MKISIQNKCISFKTRLQFDFVKCLVQTLRQSVAMATDLSFHFICKLLHILESFILSKSIFNYLFSSYPYLNTCRAFPYFAMLTDLFIYSQKLGKKVLQNLNVYRVCYNTNMSIGSSRFSSDVTTDLFFIYFCLCVFVSVFVWGGGGIFCIRWESYNFFWKIAPHRIFTKMFYEAPCNLCQF